MTQTVLYIAVSLDGYIATPDGGVDWLSPYPAEDFGYDAFAAGIDTLVMGRKTYEQMLGFGAWPHHGKRVFILSSRPLAADAPDGVERWPVDPGALKKRLRQSDYGQTWIVGGADTVRAFLDHDLIDRLDIFVIPILLGRGIPLFHPSSHATALQLEETQTCTAGVVRLVYRTE